MKIYEVKVFLHEGGPVSLGCFLSQADAEEHQAEALGDWADGPNVEAIVIETKEVR